VGSCSSPPDGHLLLNRSKPYVCPLFVIKLPSRTKISSNLEHRNKKANDIHEGKWNGLGGKFEAGETPEECVKREVAEEMGLFIRNPHLHGLLIFPSFKGNDWYVFLFTASEFSGDLIDTLGGRLEWIEDSQLSSLNLGESDHIFFPWIERREFFSANFEYQGDRMRGYEVSFHGS